MGPLLLENLYLYRANLNKKIEQTSSSDLLDLLKEELILVDEAIAAPNRPFKTNYQPA